MSSRLVFWDDFDRADGPPGTAPSGHTWVEYSPVNTSTILDGRLQITTPTPPHGAHASYPGVIVEDTPTFLDLSLSFLGTSAPAINNNVTVILSNMEGGFLGGVGHPVDMVHLTLTPTHIILNVYENAVASALIYFAEWNTHFAFDGTPGRVQVALNHDTSTITVIEPDGTVHTSTDERYMQIAGPLIITEPFWLTSDQDVAPRLDSIAVSVPSEAIVEQGIRIEEGTTNWAVNPYATVNASDGILPESGAVITRVTTNPLTGPASFRFEGDGSGSQQAFMTYGAVPGMVGGDPCTVQCCLRGTGTVQVIARLFVNGFAAVRDAISPPITLTADWSDPVAVTTWSLGGDTINQARLYVSQNWGGGSASVDAYVSDIQMEPLDHPTSICPAVDDAGVIRSGYAWTGTAHNSISTRTAGVIDLGDAGDRLNGDTGEVLIRASFDQDPSSDGGVLWQFGNFGDSYVSLVRLTDDRLRILWHEAGAGAEVLWDTTVALPRHTHTCRVQYGPSRIALIVDDVTLIDESGSFGPLDLAGKYALVGASGAGTLSSNAVIGPLVTFPRLLTAIEARRTTAYLRRGDLTISSWRVIP